MTLFWITYTISDSLSFLCWETIVCWQIIIIMFHAVELIFQNKLQI